MLNLHGLTMADLRLVCTVAETGSISAAATVLGYSQSGVSRRVAAIERATGTSLLVRLPRGVRLTTTGERLRSHAVPILQAVVRAERDLSQVTDPRRQLRVGSFSTANSRLMPAVLRNLGSVEPELEVTVREERTPRLMRWVSAGTVDVAVISDYPTPPPEEEAVALEHLFDDPLLVAFPDGHPLARRRGLKFADLASASWIEGHPSETAVLRAAAQKAGFQPVISHRVRDWNTKLEFVAAGLGVALVPRLAVTGPARGVSLRPLAESLPTRSIFLATNASSHDIDAVATFRTIVRTLAREQGGVRDEFPHRGRARAARVRPEHLATDGGAPPM